MHRSLLAWFQENGRDLPWRRRRDPYAVLVSEMMLQQTQVATVVDYFERWMTRFPDFPALAAAREDDVLHAWQGLGYYSRARNLHRAAQLVMERHAGQFPRDLSSIQALPGIGRYTAGAISAFAFDLPTPVVDGNIGRVLARLFNYRDRLDSADGQKWVWRVSAELQPASGAGLFNEALMELGATICLPGRPRCDDCPVRLFCAAKDPELLPLKKPRPKTIAMQEHCAWVFNKGRVLLEQQTGTRWRGLWKLPLLPKAPENRCSEDVPMGDPLLCLEYPFTNHRVTLSVFAAAPPDSLAESQAWFDITKLSLVAITAPHRRALEQMVEGGSGASPQGGSGASPQGGSGASPLTR